MPVLAIPAIEVGVIAMLALLVYFGFPLLAKAVTTIIPRDLPVIGSRIQDGALKLINGAASQVKSMLSGNLHLAGLILKYPLQAIRTHLNTVIGTFDAVLSFGLRLTTVTIPRYYHLSVHVAEELYNKAAALAHTLYAEAVHTAEHLYNKAVSLAHTLHTEAIHIAEQLYNRAVALTNLVHAEVVHIAEQLYNKAVALANLLHTEAIHIAEQLYNNAIAFTNAAVGDLASRVESYYKAALAYAEAQAAAAARGVLSTLNGSAHAALGAIWPDILTGVKGVEGALGADLPDIRAALRELDLSVPGDLTAGLAVTGAMSLTMLRYLEKCGIPNCKNLGGFGHDLQALFGLVEGGALLAFLGEIVTDPEAAAAEVKNTMVEPITAVAHTFENLIGL